MAINPLLNGGFKLQPNTNNPGMYASADDYLKLVEMNGGNQAGVQQWIAEYAQQNGIPESQLAYQGPNSARDRVQNQLSLEGNPNYAAGQPTALMRLQEKPYQMPTYGQPQLPKAQGLLGMSGGQSASPTAGMDGRPMGAPMNQRNMGIPQNQDRMQAAVMPDRTKEVMRGQRQPQQFDGGYINPLINSQSQGRFYQPGRAYTQGQPRGYRPPRYTGRGQQKRGLLGY